MKCITDDFINELLKLEPAEAIGVATMLKVKLVEEKDDTEEPRDAAYILSDLIKKYASLPRQTRRNLMKIIKSSTKVRKNNEYASDGSEANGSNESM